MPNFCLFDVGSTYTKGCIVDTDQEMILAQASDFTTSSTEIVSFWRTESHWVESQP